MRLQGHLDNIGANPTDADCSIDVGIFFYQMRGVNVITGGLAEAMDNSSRLLQFLAKKYHLDTTKDGWQASIGNTNEKNSAAIALSKLREGWRILNYVNDLDHVRKLNALSLKRYWALEEGLSRMTDESQLGSVTSSVDEALASVPGEQKLIVAVLMRISEIMPAEE
jgi:hypothetical protein